MDLLYGVESHLSASPDYDFCRLARQHDVKYTCAAPKSIHFLLPLADLVRTRSIVLILAVCTVAVALSAADNAFMGTWKLHEAKSKIPAGAGKNTTVVYSPAGDETKVTTDGVDGLGKPSHWEWTGNFDGKPYPVTGMSSIDSRSVTAKGDRILDIANMKDGKKCRHRQDRSR